MFLNAICSIIGFLLAVRWGIVAVAASFVIVGYLLAPISYMAVRRLIQIDIRTYLLQFWPPLSASLLMAIVVEGLKYLLRNQDQALNAYLQLSIYLLAGGSTYTLVIGLTARQQYQEILGLVSHILPDRKLNKT